MGVFFFGGGLPLGTPRFFIGVSKGFTWDSHFSVFGDSNGWLGTPKILLFGDSIFGLGTPSLLWLGTPLFDWGLHWGLQFFFLTTPRSNVWIRKTENITRNLLSFTTVDKILTYDHFLFAKLKKLHPYQIYNNAHI